jgi:biopolymer transport protein ExbD
MLALLFLLIGDPTPDVHLPPPVDLPAGFHTTAQTKALADDAMRVCVTRDGRVFFRDLQVVPEDLPEVVREAIQGGAEKKVYLAVDARAKYGDAAAVVGEVGKAGIREICILAYKPEE